MSPEPRRRIRILYVEDDRGNQDLMRSVIAKRPAVELVVVGLGADAMPAALAVRPSLIVLDHRLPDMTGDEIIALLRTRTETERIPILVVSGETTIQTDDHPAVIGHLTKPYDIRELLAHVDRISLSADRS